MRIAACAGLGGNPLESFHIPRLRTMARNALPHIVEGTLLPLGLFYGAMWTVGIWGAIAISLAWSWGAVAVRLLSGRRVPGLLLVGAVALTARSIVSFLADSVFVYFLQPTLGTVVLAAAFLVSAPAGRPLAERLAGDFLVMPDWFASHPAIRRFFVRVTVLWGAIQLANAGVALWLLLSQPIPVYLVSKTAATTAVMAVAIAGSTLWFRRLVDRHGLGTPPAVRDTVEAG
jgi:uncharacterized membrane protein